MTTYTRPLSEKKRTRQAAIAENGGITLAMLAERYCRRTGTQVSRTTICKYLKRKGVPGHIRYGYPEAAATRAVDEMPLPRAISRAHACLTRDQLQTGEYLPLCYISATQDIPRHRLDKAAYIYSIKAFVCGGILWAKLDEVKRWWNAANKNKR